MKKSFRVLFAVLLSGLAFVFSGCNDQKPQEKLTVGLDATFPPYEYHSGTNLAGIDPDIMRIAAKELETEVVFVEMKFDTLLYAVSSGKIDVAASAIAVNSDRKKLVDFTDVYDSSELVVVLPPNSKIKQISDLQDKAIGVQKGTSSDDYVTGRFQRAERFLHVDAAFKNLLEGKVDAVVTDLGPVDLQLFHNKRMTVLKFRKTREEYAFAVRKGRDDLKEKLNAVIFKLQSSGKLAEIKAQHEKAAAEL